MESAVFVDPYANFRSRTGGPPVEEAKKRVGVEEFKKMRSDLDVERKLRAR